MQASKAQEQQLSGLRKRADAFSAEADELRERLSAVKVRCECD